MTTLTHTAKKTARKSTESKRERFLRLGNERLQEALINIRLLKSQFQNPYAYQFDNTDVNRVKDLLECQVKDFDRFIKA